MLSITLIGNAPQPILRSGTRRGDVLLVTGTLGDSAAALVALQNGTKVSGELLQRHHRPSPRLKAMCAALTIENAVHAALDLSDGLAGDAAHIARASNVTLEIESARLPVSRSCHAMAQIQSKNALDWALSGGEDYELLLCVAKGKAKSVRAAMENSGTPCTIIGRVVPREDAPVVLRHNENGNEKREPAQGGFAHF